MTQEDIESTDFRLLIDNKYACQGCGSYRDATKR